MLKNLTKACPVKFRPEFRQQPVPLVHHPAVNPQDERGDQNIGPEEMPEPDRFHRHQIADRYRRIDADRTMKERIGNVAARQKQHQDRRRHDPVEQPQERTEDVNAVNPLVFQLPHPPQVLI